MTKLAVGDKVKLEGLVVAVNLHSVTVDIDEGDGCHTTVVLEKDSVELIAPGPAKIGDLVVIARGAEAEVYTVIGIDGETLWLKAPLGSYRYEAQGSVVVVDRA